MSEEEIDDGLDLTGPTTPPLKDFLEAYDDDDNVWWHLACGHHMNLFDEAVDRFREAERKKQLAELDAATLRMELSTLKSVVRGMLARGSIEYTGDMSRKLDISISVKSAPITPSELDVLRHIR